MNPTARDYNNFRYLWYVGLSRACDDMVIYCDSDRNVWYELANCSPNLYKFMGKQLKLIEPVFEKNIRRPSSITELLKTKYKINLNKREYMFELGLIYPEFNRYKQWNKLFKKIIAI